MGNPDNEDTFYDGKLIKTDKNEKHYIDGLKREKFYYTQAQNIIYLNGTIEAK